MTCVRRTDGGVPLDIAQSCAQTLLPRATVAGPAAESAPFDIPDRGRWFREEVHPHELQLKAHLRNAFPSIRDVDDVVQESYLRLWRRHVTNPICSARSFLYKVARHLAIDAIRRGHRSPCDEVADLASLAILDPKPEAAEDACTSEELDLLWQAIDSLPPRCREIVILRKLRGLTQKEIALHMGISERTVEVQGTKGLDRCEAFLRARGVIRRKLP